MVILLSLMTNFYPKIVLTVVYTHLFVFLRGLIRKLDPKSHVAVILEVFVAHIYTYAKALGFVLLFVLSISFSLIPFVEIGGSGLRTTSLELFGILLCISFDSEWIVVIQEFRRIVPKLGEAHRIILAWVLYVVHAFVKHILFQMFTSVVISSKFLLSNRLPAITSNQRVRIRR